MKINKYYFLFILAGFLYCQIPEHCIVQNLPDNDLITQSNQESLGEQLLATAKENAPDKFKKLVQQIVRQYRSNHKELFKILDTRDDHYLNILFFTTLIGDLENMSVIFDALKEGFGNDTMWLFRYLNTRDKTGRNLLSAAEYNANHRTMELVLMRVIELIGHDHELFFKFMTAGDYEHNWKAVIDASEDSESRNLEMMVKLTEKILGEESVFFKQFINTSDSEGDTPINSAQTPETRFFLERYGAIMTKPADQTPEVEKAIEYGHKLIEASNLGNFKEFKKIIDTALEEFQDQQHLIYHILYAKDDAGWNVIIHTAADGQYKYLKLLLALIKKYFAADEKELKSIILASTDFEGRTSLHMAINRRHYKVARLLVETYIEHGVNKPMIFAVLNTPNELNGFTPFMNAVYGVYQFDHDAYEFVKYMIQKAENYFGRDSRMFWLFLNARDYNGWTPLDYAADKQIEELLKSYSAINTPMKKVRSIGVFKHLDMRGIV